MTFLADLLDLYARVGWALLLLALIAGFVLGAVALLTGPWVAPAGYDEPPSRLDRLDRPRFIAWGRCETCGPDQWCRCGGVG